MQRVQLGKTWSHRRFDLMHSEQDLRLGGAFRAEAIYRSFILTARVFLLGLHH